MNRYRKNGFTLLEMLLVLTIASTVMVMITAYITQKSAQTQRDKVVIQMQQILDAGLAYYNMNGTWPITGFLSPGYTRVPLDPTIGGAQNGQPLFTKNYIPSAKSFYTNPLGLAAGCDPKYYIDFNSNTGVFSVIAYMCGQSSAANAAIIAGQLPSGFITSTLPAASAAGTTPAVPAYSACTAGSTCYVVAQVNMPGQNLNNARSVNFAGIYHNGGCVPAPSCPNGFHSDIMLAVTEVRGLNSPGTSTYPIQAFVARAYGGANDSTGKPALPNNVADCYDPSTATACSSTGPSATPMTGAAAGQLYWRVCLLISTSAGQVNSSGYSSWAQYSQIMAITRCTPDLENGGSDFKVWTQ